MHERIRGQGKGVYMSALGKSSASPPTHLSTYPLSHLFIHPPIHPSVHPPSHPSVLPSLHSQKQSSAEAFSDHQPPPQKTDKQMSPMMEVFMTKPKDPVIMPQSYCLTNVLLRKAEFGRG